MEQELEQQKKKGKEGDLALYINWKKETKDNCSILING